MNESGYSIPSVGFLREKQILGCRKEGIPAIIPISRTSWWNGVKSGIYPQPIKLSARTTVWRAEDIRAFLETLGKEAA